MIFIFEQVPQSEAFSRPTERQALKVIKRFLVFGHPFFRGVEINAAQEPAELFNHEWIDVQTQWLRAKSAERVSVDAHIATASFPSSYDQNLAVAVYNPRFSTTERLGQVLRLYRGQSVNYFCVNLSNGARRGHRAAPQGTEKWSEEAQAPRRTYDVAGLTGFDWGFSRTVRDATSKKSREVLIAVELSLLRGF